MNKFFLYVLVEGKNKKIQIIVILKDNLRFLFLILIIDLIGFIIQKAKI